MFYFEAVHINVKTTQNSLLSIGIFIRIDSQLAMKDPLKSYFERFFIFYSYFFSYSCFLDPKWFGKTRVYVYARWIPVPNIPRIIEILHSFCPHLKFGVSRHRLDLNPSVASRGSLSSGFGEVYRLLAFRFAAILLIYWKQVLVEFPGTIFRSCEIGFCLRI